MHDPRPLIAPWFASLDTELVRLRPRAWLAFLAAGLGVGLVASMVGDENAVQPAVFAMGIAATAAILIGVRINHPPRPLPWQLLAVCMALTTAGAAVTHAAGAFGWVGLALSAAGSLFGLAGFLLLIRGRIPGGDRAAALDAAILATGTGVVVWAFGFAPLILEARQSSVIPAAFFYPALVALAMVARMWFMRGAHRPGTRLIVLFILASNGITILDMLRGVVGATAFAGPYLLTLFASLALVGAAALHPSMAIAPERQRADLRPLRRRRILALAAALLINPATLAIEAMLGHAIDPAPYLVGGIVIGLLVIGRLADTLRELGDSLRERETLMHLLSRQALHDGLTSLPNRSLFTQRLAADFANRSADRILAVLLIDLDDFKSVNDGSGHDAGDALLIAVGQRLREAIRDGDIAARLGGDEFVIALPGCADREAPIAVARRVLAALAEPFDIGGQSLTTAASIGVALATPDDASADELIRNADVAMYVAKRHGKGRFEVFEASMQAAAMTQLQLRTDLAAGIAAGDLRLHFQPIVELQSGQTVGYEALVRWDRDGALIAPGDFIPMAESSGLIGPLTDWVVAEACRTAAGWGGPGDRRWVSVNFSSSQLLRVDIVDSLRRSLDLSGLSPDRLIVEVTESALLEFDVARPAIERLAELGVRVAIDDFGTGYSALSYLARLPINIVKIDRSFVIALEHPGPEQAIASAIIALARRLGMVTIGEGIETPAQLYQLAALGCDLGQGFYIGRPAAVADRRWSPLAGADKAHAAGATRRRGDRTGTPDAGAHAAPKHKAARSDRRRLPAPGPA